jgi:hypothetical protein
MAVQSERLPKPRRTPASARERASRRLPDAERGHRLSAYLGR